MWTIGLAQSGNEMGLPEDRVNRLSDEELMDRLAAIDSRYREAGAHYVAKGIWECLDIVEEINRRLANGEHPQFS